MSEPSTNTWLQLITEQPLGIAVLILVVALAAAVWIDLGPV